MAMSHAYFLAMKSLRNSRRILYTVKIVFAACSNVFLAAILWIPSVLHAYLFTCSVVETKMDTTYWPRRVIPWNGQNGTQAFGWILRTIETLDWSPEACHNMSMPRHVYFSISTVRSTPGVHTWSVIVWRSSSSTMTACYKWSNAAFGLPALSQDRITMQHPVGDKPELAATYSRTLYSVP